ncbi:hypothetical protein [Novosphingobium sp.]|uniref:hypothetical protein n=1 Tax=Novosphingobium sp. TaxID=1874826 RepID=UPI00334127D6
MTMVPLGYMLKSVTSPAPDWLNAPGVVAVHSLSNCISPDLGDYIPMWCHNGWWLFDTPDAADNVALTMGTSVDSLTLFYYEAFHQQFDEESETWMPFAPNDFATAVVAPYSAVLSGFDVVTFSVGTSPECSPLSCNRLAESLKVNQNCLFDSFDEARAAIENGSFRNSEPGPYRIIAIHAVDNFQAP